jgi:hypothetical protein
MPRHFKSIKSYKKWKAFVHMHNIKTKPDRYVYIAGKRHAIRRAGKARKVRHHKR